jgi:hypothetical protein
MKSAASEWMGQIWNQSNWRRRAAASPVAIMYRGSGEVILSILSVNCVGTAAKERLRPSLALGNVKKTMAPPVTVIIAYDLKFYDKLPTLFQHYLAVRDMFVKKPS